jgi:DNA-binding HxlR family transcriptional regulator
VQKEPYQQNPVRYSYSLTDKGRDLGPLMKEMINWAKKYEQEVIRPGKTSYLADQP